MQNLVEIKKLDFSYGEKVIFKDFDLEIKPKRFVTILGKNGSGKTTLINILMGLIDSKGKIIIDGIILSKETKKFLRKDIGIVFENPDEHFVTDRVYDELAFILESQDYQKDDIDDKIVKVSELIGIEDLLNRKIISLSVGEKQLVALAIAIINKPKLLIMDEGLSNVDSYYREIILKILNV